MNRETRIAIMVGAVVLFGLGLLLGFLLGRTGGEEVAEGTPSPSPTPAATGTQPQVVPSPTQEAAPAISTEGQVLQQADRAVTPASQDAACGALVHPGTLGECGEVPVAGQRVVWVVEQETTPTGAPAFTLRILSYVPDSAGWVEWLEASDVAGERWSDVNVVASDLTDDGVSELVVGFRSIAEDRTLEYDIVGYSETGVPEVLAHPDPAAMGSVVIAGGTIQEYAAQYPNDEPVCCPSEYQRRTIGFRGGFFRAFESETVVPTAVPLSQL